MAPGDVTKNGQPPQIIVDCLSQPSNIRTKQSEMNKSFCQSDHQSYYWENMNRKSRTKNRSPLFGTNGVRNAKMRTKSNAQNS
jgi:hypothetical protein